MWFCHECGAEMRPLMIPDPHCASCNGTFVEKMENPTDNPRDFHHGHPGLDDDLYPGQENFVLGLGDLLRSNSGGGGGFTLHINGTQSPGGNTRTFVLSPRPGASGGSTDRVPPLSDFARGGTQTDRTPGGGMPPQQAMISHLLSALAQRHSDRPQGFNPFADLLGAHGPGPTGPDGSGAWGDYVHNQEALDQIITQLMENSNSHRPVPASEEVIAKLKREVLEEGSSLLQRDCAVCKDQFKIDSEDPDEQIIITLPCNHPYHQSCILPWLKSSGTCPVCRYQLVPQPGNDATPAPPAPPDAGSSSDQRSPPGRSGSQGGGMFNNILSYLGGGGSTSSNNGTRHSRNQSNSRPGDRRAPGGWSDELD